VKLGQTPVIKGLVSGYEQARATLIITTTLQSRPIIFKATCIGFSDEVHHVTLNAP
jgi:hypothetical protein